MNYNKVLESIVNSLLKLYPSSEMLKILTIVKERSIKELEQLEPEKIDKIFFENQIKIVFYNKCDEMIRELFLSKNKIWKEFFHIVYNRNILRAMVKSFFFKKGYITDEEEKNYTDEIVEEVEEKLLSQPEYILNNALYLRSYIKKMIRNAAINFCSRTIVKRQMFSYISEENIIDSIERSEEEKGGIPFTQLVISQMDNRPDINIIRREQEKKIRLAYKNCISKLTLWQRILIEIVLDIDNNLYKAYEKGNLVENALEKGLIKRKYTYQAVKNHAESALELLRNCMKLNMEEN